MQLNNYPISENFQNLTCILVLACAIICYHGIWSLLHCVLGPAALAPSAITTLIHIVRTPEKVECTADTFRALHIVSKTSQCAIDTFRTKYLTILCDASPKLG